MKFFSFDDHKVLYGFILAVVVVLALSSLALPQTATLNCVGLTATLTMSDGTTAQIPVTCLTGTQPPVDPPPTGGSVFVPPSPSITDIKGRVWTLATTGPNSTDKYLLVNGSTQAPAGGAAGVLLAYCSSVFHHKNAGAEWYRLNTNDSWSYIGKTAPCP